MDEKCRHCGAPLFPDSVACTYCDVDLPHEAAAPPPPTPPERVSGGQALAGLAVLLALGAGAFVVLRALGG